MNFISRLFQGGVRDVLIDTAGGLAGILTLLTLSLIWQKHNHHTIIKRTLNRTATSRARKNTQKRRLVARNEADEDIDLPGYLLDDLKDDEPESKKAAPVRQIRKPGERYKGKFQ